jgi:SAM-dependent methyltransferase
MQTPTQFKQMQVTRWLQGFSQAYIKGRVLDAGCGRNPYKGLFDVPEWVGLDVRPVGDVMSPIEDFTDTAGFDTILCVDVLGDVPIPHMVVNSLAALLRPEGHLLIVAPLTERSDIGMGRFSVRYLEWLVKNAGLEPIESATIGGIALNEYEAWQQQGEYANAEPEGFRGFLGHMDERYPALSVMVARKAPNGCDGVPVG